MPLRIPDLQEFHPSSDMQKTYDAVIDQLPRVEGQP
jgi:hypothetical protein